MNLASVAILSVVCIRVMVSVRIMSPVMSLVRVVVIRHDIWRDSLQSRSPSPFPVVVPARGSPGCLKCDGYTLALNSHLHRFTPAHPSTIDASSMTTQPPQDPQHGRGRSPVRAPTMTYHPAPLLRLPSPDFLNPVASGAHYSGALSPPPSEHISHFDSRKRSLSMTGDDPMVEELYKDVLNDLEEVCRQSSVSDNPQSKLWRCS